MGWSLRVLALLGLASVSRIAYGQQAPGDYREATAALRRRVITAEQLVISGIELGKLALDSSEFSAHVTNQAANPVVLGLSLRAVPGLWLRGNWQRGYRFVIPGGTTQTIRASYLFRRMTPMATLRIQLGPPSEDGGGTSVPAPFYDTTLVVGARNPAATDPRLDFDHLATAHLELFAWRGSLAAQRLQALAASREAALSQVAELLAVAPPAQIRLVFYPDSASKTSQTGHIGAGFASGTTIVEIFNDSVQLDPFHEITHIVSYARGSPPALLDEGFAVYVSERLGADALKYLGAPGRTVAATVCAQRQAGALFPLPRLFRFTDIGSDSTRPDVSYPQAASVVAFLVERFGIERFRELYGRLESDTAVSIQRRNEAVLAELYGMDSAALDSVWIAWLNCP